MPYNQRRNGRHHSQAPKRSSLPAKTPVYLVQPIERRTLLSGNMLVFTTPPGTANAGAVIDASAGIQVSVQTAAGQPVITSTDRITLSLGINPGAATLSGTLTATAVAGVATFSSLSIDRASNDYTLIASDITNFTVQSAVSTLFNVNAIPSFNTLKSFAGGPEGGGPGALVQDASGNLYGADGGGGLYNAGTLFELSGTNHSIYTTLFTFNMVNGAYPSGKLVIDPAGNLYGITIGGGSSGEGTVFKLSGPDHTRLTTLTAFQGNFIYDQRTDLILDPSGNLFGTTYTGGSFGNGMAFELSGPDLTTFTDLHDFNVGGRNPNGITFRPDRKPVRNNGIRK